MSPHQKILGVAGGGRGLYILKYLRTVHGVLKGCTAGKFYEGLAFRDFRSEFFSHSFF